jgi:hypothetical protein
MGSCASQGNCVVLGLVILRITFAICSKISLFLNFHFFAKVWSIKLLAKHFARDLNALAIVLRMSSARRNCDKKVLAQRGGGHCTYAREGKIFSVISDWLIPSLHQLFTCLAAEVRYLSDIL